VPDGDLLNWSLGLRYYAGFTSPIRKYADLIAHRQVIGMPHTDRLSAQRGVQHGCTAQGLTSADDFISFALLLNMREANVAAFSKAVANSFSTL
jgi:exoribonuclease R